MVQLDRGKDADELRLRARRAAVEERDPTVEVVASGVRPTFLGDTLLLGHAKRRDMTMVGDLSSSTANAGATMMATRWTAVMSESLDPSASASACYRHSGSPPSGAASSETQCSSAEVHEAGAQRDPRA